MTKTLLVLISALVLAGCCGLPDVPFVPCIAQESTCPP